MVLINAIGLILFGLMIGTAGTLIGAGGGFFVVPFLMLCYDFPPQTAVGTSLAVVFLNVLSGTFAYIKQRKIDYDLGIKFAVAASPGVLVGVHIAKSFSPFFFVTAFSLILFLTSYYLLAGKNIAVARAGSNSPLMKKKMVDSCGNTHEYDVDMEVGFAGSFFVGFMSSMFGLGGGIIHVPFMVLLLGIPMHIATATSHFMLAIVSFLGVLDYLILGNIDVDFAALIGVGSIMGAYIGAHLSTVTDGSLIRKIIGLALIVIALRMLLTLFG
ncbi:MAG: sulfite exporter TauE/SafE family protein [Nitrospirota bacterium]|nr:sulfite exporter TauE/SafE family protein [Nitrospirota bacterium]